MVLSQAVVSPATIVIGDTFTVTSTLTPEASVTGIVAELWGRINSGAWVKAATKTVGNVTINVPVVISIPCPATQAGAAEVYIKVYQSTNPPPTGPYQDSGTCSISGHNSESSCIAAGGVWTYTTFTIYEVTPPPSIPWWIPIIVVVAVGILGIGIYASRRKTR